MRVKLLCGDERRELLKSMLERGGFEVADEADLVLTEAGYVPEYLLGRQEDAYTMVGLAEIVSIETVGREVYIFSRAGQFRARERLYELERLLPEDFLRVSQSVIVRRGAIRRILPNIGMRFTLILADGRRAYVTRNYYYQFKSEIGF